jgi:hypothetical protein
MTKPPPLHVAKAKSTGIFEPGDANTSLQIFHSAYKSSPTNRPPSEIEDSAKKFRSNFAYAA